MVELHGIGQFSTRLNNYYIFTQTSPGRSLPPDRRKRAEIRDDDENLQRARWRGRKGAPEPPDGVGKGQYPTKNMKPLGHSGYRIDDAAEEKHQKPLEVEADLSLNKFYNHLI